MNEVKFEIDNTYIHYVKFGEGPKNLIIVSGVSLCGLEGLGAAIAKQFSILTKDYTCYVFDRKVELKKGTTIEDLADDLYKVLTSLGIKKADFIGYSQGGMITQSLALKYPDMVEKMILTSTTARANEISDYVWKKCREYLNANDVHGFNMFLYERIYSEKFFKENERALDRLANNGTEKQIERFIYLTESMDAFDVRDELKNIKCPCFVIGAMNDQIFGVDASKELANLLGCEMYIYQNQAHAVCDEAADYNAIVLRFLNNN